LQEQFRSHAFQLWHRLEGCFQTVHDSFLWIHTGNPLLYESVSIDDHVSWKGAHSERAHDAVVRIQILRPIHLLLRDEIAPCFLILVAADADKDDFGVGVFSSQIFQFGD